MTPSPGRGFCLPPENRDSEQQSTERSDPRVRAQRSFTLKWGDHNAETVDYEPGVGKALEVAADAVYLTAIAVEGSTAHHPRGTVFDIFAPVFGVVRIFFKLVDSSLSSG
jgi:hypothetical protein